jgi:hypothetical protein
LAEKESGEIRYEVRILVTVGAIGFFAPCSFRQQISMTSEASHFLCHFQRRSILKIHVLMLIRDDPRSSGLPGPLHATCRSLLLARPKVA